MENIQKEVNNLVGIHRGGIVPKDVLDEHIAMCGRRDTVLPLRDIEKMKDAIKSLGKNSFDSINIGIPILPERK